MYLTCRDYLTKWSEIADIFHRESVLRGSFDRYAESTKVKKGTAEVDDQFLSDIEAWRKTLARNLALRNSDLDTRDLNFAVQKIIDRIIFLRICEDRAIEPYGRLRDLTNGEGIYQRLRQMFVHADDRYNSGLFHFSAEKGRSESPDTLTPTLVLDDKPLRDILRGLYYPDSPYEFSVIPAEILGHVYEQFLGKVIRLTVVTARSSRTSLRSRRPAGCTTRPRTSSISSFVKPSSRSSKVARLSRSPSYVSSTRRAALDRF